MALDTVLVNGRSYDFASISVIIGGVPFRGISSINYTQEQEKTNNFGTGNSPVSRGRGMVETTASIDFSMNEVEKLRTISDDGSLLSLTAFDIVITYGNPQAPVVHTLKNCEFMTDGVETSQGDTDIARSFDLIVSDVKYA